MNILTLIASFLIVFGAIIMAINLVKFNTISQMISDFSLEKFKMLKNYFILHRVLMVFFLLGYLFVFVALITGKHIVNDLMVGLIFFFGALFVLLGIFLQLFMLKEIKKSFEKEIKIGKTLETEHSKLVVLNEQLVKEVSDREKTEHALRESEKRLRTIIDCVQVGIVIVDAASHKIVNINPAALEMVRGQKEEIIGTECYKIICPCEQGKCPITDLKQSVNSKECDLKEASGKQKKVLKTVIPIMLEGKSCLLESFFDITQKKDYEEKLKNIEKMEAIGVFAGEVVHDLNNMLAAFVSYPELILQKIPADSPVKKYITALQKSGKKATAIVQELLTLTRRVIATNEIIHLNLLIQEYLKSPEFKRLMDFHPQVIVETDLDDHLQNISGSSVHLFKTIMNLMSNAAESIKDKGEIAISTCNQRIDNPKKGFMDIEAGDYVVLKISDTGIGIHPDHRKRIFEPFFTKKIQGKSGTGLGMAVVWRCVQDHRGFIDIDGEEEKGTSFSLYFPATHQEMELVKDSLAVKDYQGNGESILVVDDIAEQRELACGMLTALGYHAESVAGGEEALIYLETNKADLLLLDMLMNPGINGLETYQRVLQKFPKMKAVIVSGFSEVGLIQEALRLGAGSFVKKPYTLEQIGMAIKQELARDSQ